MISAITVDSRDTLAVALRSLEKGETVEVNGEAVTLLEDVEAKHKFALLDFAEGDLTTQYGVTVGRATQPISKGGLVSTENLVHAAGSYSGKKEAQAEWDVPDISAWKERTFNGFPRSNGSVGTENHWIVIPMVFCENRNVDVLREAIAKPLGYTERSHYEAFGNALADACRAGIDAEGIREFRFESESATASRPFSNVDGVKFLTHGLGCGGTRGDANALCGLLAGYATHPNVAGVTVLSLGCQNAEVRILQEEIEKRDPGFDRPFLLFEQQNWPSEREMIESAIRDTVAGIAEANKEVRAPAPLSKLILGTECGGSDGFSGISANPTVGRVSDLLVALGSRVILSEFPELCGVEQELVNRCADDETAEQYAALMDAYSAAARAVGSSLDANPSPGNIKDGLITDAIKSAGAAKKGGTSPIRSVLDYPEAVCRDGLTLLNTPGNDVESTTAMAGSHANLIVFTTGLGTPTGNPVTPVIKISSNTELATRMADLIDFDAGAVIRGEMTVNELAEALLDFIIEVASGRVATKSRLLGQDDFLPWKRGVSL